MRRYLWKAGHRQPKRCVSSGTKPRIGIDNFPQVLPINKRVYQRQLGRTELQRIGENIKLI